MELFMLFLYAISIFAFFLSIQTDDNDLDNEDSGEFNLIDPV